MKFYLLPLYLFFLIKSTYAANVSIIDSDIHAAQKRFFLTQKAQKEILISYFIYEDDELGLFSFSHLLKLKKEKPHLQIKILLDGITNQVNKSILYILEENGIEVREFHSLPHFFPGKNNLNLKSFINGFKNLNRRMHDKLLIVDGASFITGGRNIANGYFGISKKNFHDRDIFTDAKKASQDARKYYLTLWNSDHVSSLNYKVNHKGSKSYLREKVRLHQSSLEKTKKLQPLKKGLLDFEEYFVQDSKVRFLSSYFHKKDGFFPGYLANQIFGILVQAQDSILIQTPYLLPTKKFSLLVKDLYERNIDLKISTNSYCSTDSNVVLGAYDIRKKELLETGVEVTEFIGPDHLHGKSVVIDNRFSLIGTYNFDPRSAYINTEVALLIDDEKIAEKLSMSINEDIKSSSKLSLENDKVIGSYKNCRKKLPGRMIYKVSKPISRLNWLYRLL